MSSEASKGVKAVLAFDGLDTFAVVRLDGRTILRSDNMFLPHRVDVSEQLQGGSEHHLEIVFDSALLKAREIKKKHPDHKWTGFNGDMARLAVRKAQYHWGWDWGPILNDAGIWKQARLEIYESRIADAWTELDIAEDYQSVQIHAFAEVETSSAQILKTKFTVILGGKELSSATTAVGKDGKASAELHLDKPSLWFPAGYGSQTLYTVKTQILPETEEVQFDEVSKNIGIRKVQLIQEPDRRGKTFFFRVNEVDIYCGGSCWIPTDSFLPRITPDKYRAWIKLMVPANQKMIRYVIVLNAMFMCG